MVLLNDIVEIFLSPDGAQPTPAAHGEQAVHVELLSCVRSTFVDHDLVRPAVIAGGFHEKRSCWTSRLGATQRREEYAGTLDAIEH